MRIVHCLVWASNPRQKLQTQRRGTTQSVASFRHYEPVGFCYAVLMAPIRKKLVVVGDGSCGKTSLLQRFTSGAFSDEHEPTVFENYVADIMLKKKKVELTLWDTAGQEDYDRIRPFSYIESDVVLLCFDVGRPITLENAVMKWVGEIRYYCPGVPVIVVANKADLRKEQATVSATDGSSAADRIGAYAYIECSAKSGEAVAEVFEIAVRATLQKQKKANKWCCFVC
ncbi:hypothetical protein QR680_002728 [Steinernema hermaphroditum]|uniref:Uncharacterized protein n=1 Tax=Steinernema hermaphroditum TaxID=289476 RepID=A0AA39LIN7_9BILA|nr:hypothetical protein QR680_002728 [Steinernema hermaphroditum]